MMWLILAVIFVFIAAVVFSVIGLIRRICKKSYSTLWIISKACFSVCAISLIIAVSDGQWNITVLLASLLLIAYGIYQAFIWGICKIRHNSIKISRRKAMAALGTGLCAMIISISGNLTSALNLFAVLLFFATLVMLFVNVVRAIFKRKTKLLWLSVPACLLTGILLMVAANCIWNNQLEKRVASGEIYEEPIQITYDFEVADGDMPLEVVTSKQHDFSNRSTLYVYDETDLHLALENDFVTAEQCIEAIYANDKIEPRFKTFFCDFVERIEKTYPGLNLAILYRNLETLDVQELNSTDYFWESLNIDSLGCYNKRKNTIFIPEGTEYVEGEFGFQVLLHEFCHAVRTGHYETDDAKCTFEFYGDSDNILLSEAMNSAFSCSLLDYYEWNIAYQVPSNYLRIMLECMDNYSLEDYIRHGDTYFLSKLDEFTGNTNYAQVIWKLIALQRSDWEQDNMDIPPEEYHPIYDFLCRIYYGKYVSETMTAEEKKAIADELVHKAFYDAPENYKIDPDYFYEYLGLETSV